MVIGVSRGILDVYRDAGLIRESQCRVIYNQVPTKLPSIGSLTMQMRERLGLRAGDRVILYVGRISPGKGAEVFVRAAGKVGVFHPEAMFVLAGKGQPLTHLSPARLKFLGSIPQEEVFALYQIAEMVVCPAIWPEPLCRVPIEAALFAKPAIVSHTGGFPEIVLNEETGLVVAKGDVEVLANAICRLLEDPCLAQRLGENARRINLERFNDKQAREISELYKKVWEPIV